MNLLLIHLHPRANARLPYEAEVAHYLKLTSRAFPAKSRAFPGEDAVIDYIEGARQRPTVVLCDSGGKMLSSEEFAAWVGRRRDAGSPEILLGIGPADGWSKKMLERADLRLSFGLVTLPHALARLVLAEQVYRASTILTGHPYHLGH